jgi:hypothetical protein
MEERTMTIQELLGSAYKDGMTLDEINAALADRTLLDEAQVESIVNNRTAAQKRLLDSANKKLAEAQKKNTDVGTENADLLARLAVLEDESKEAKRKASIASIKASLIAQGYDEALAEETAVAMESNDLAKIIENQGKFLTNKTQAIKDELLNGTKPPVVGNGVVAVTKDDLKKMSLAEKSKFAAENPEQYKEIYGGN